MKYAKKIVSGKQAPKNVSAEFFCDDILHYVKKNKQESFDFVIGIASFQHIPTSKERFFLIKNIYRILKYDGKLLMTNRSFSRRFVKKYKTVIIKALWKYSITRGKYQRNDLMIPRTNKNISYKRFYHIYTLRELKKLMTMSGFLITKLGYLHK